MAPNRHSRLLLCETEVEPAPRGTGVSSIPGLRSKGGVFLKMGPREELFRANKFPPSPA